MKRGVLTAIAANMTKAIADFHNARQASVVICELGKELSNRKRLNVAFASSSFRGALTLAGFHGDLL
ncbi:MAG TPA: hypothetical protein VIF02_12885, partial [Methylocella sp.]